MKNIEVNETNLQLLVDHLRKEDREELIGSFGKNFERKFINVSLNAKEKYFIADDFGFPLAIGGAEEKIYKNLKIGQVWLISSEKFTRKNFELIKFIRNKIEDFKEKYDVLFNTIYKSNYKSLNWLTKCGFCVLDISLKKHKLFYFTKGGLNFDLRYIAR